MKHALIPLLLALAAPLPAPVAGAEQAPLPDWLHLVPYGEWRGHPARPFQVGPAEAAQILANHDKRGGTRLVLDYEHQTIRSLDNGRPAPAAGWIDRLELREDGVWGHVEGFTPAAEAFLRAREYRYLSPVLAFDRRDKRTGEAAGLHLHSAALTNVPFLDELTPVVNSDTTTPENSMLELRKLLGLADDATDLEVVAAVEAHLTTLRSGLGLAADAPVTLIASTLQAARLPLELGRLALTELQLGEATPEVAKAKLARELKHSGYVPLAEHAAAVAAAEQQVVTLSDDQVIEQARAQGKLTPALEALFRKQLARDREGTMAWLAEAPVVVPLSSPIARNRGASATQGQLSDAELAVCAQLNLSHDNYRRHARQEA